MMQGGRTTRGTLGAEARAFTLVETLVVLAIIALLVGLVSVGGGRLRRAAQESQTIRLMQTIQQGLTQFHEDLGYYPPLLDDSTNATKLLTVVGGNLNAKDADYAQNLYSERQKAGFYSNLSLVPYLAGVGDLNLNGKVASNDLVSGTDDSDLDDGRVGYGFLDPGPDRSFGGAIRSPDRELFIADRHTESRGQCCKKVFGPYVDATQADAVTPAISRQTSSQDSARYKIAGNDAEIFMFTDSWGQPIRYYQGWLSPADLDNVRDSDPKDGYPDAWPQEWYGSLDKSGLESFKSSLRSAPFVLMSTGRDMKGTITDGSSDNTEAAEAVNKDNIVEVGL